jgi:hypothetical protein
MSEEGYALFRKSRYCSYHKEHASLSPPNGLERSIQGVFALTDDRASQISPIDNVMLIASMSTPLRASLLKHLSISITLCKHYSP